MSDAPIVDPDLEKRVRGYVRARIPREDTEDVVQDAWLRIVKNKSKYDPKRGPVWPWAKYHCKSAVAEYYRRRQPDPDDEDVDAAVPPSRSLSHYERLLEVTFTSPGDIHQLIAFAYVELLEWKPSEVVAELSDQALEDLGNRFVVEYSAQFTYHRNLILDLLRPFTERLRGARTRLADTFSVHDDEKKCAAELSRWRHTVQRRIRSDLLYLKALEALLTNTRPRHQQIVYGLIEILRWSPRRLADRHGRESLKSLAEELEEGCSSGERMHLQSLVERIFRPLHQDPSLAGRTLYDFVPEGRSPAAELVLWCQELGVELHAAENPEGTRS